MKTKKTRVYFKHYKDSDLVRYAYRVGAKLTQSDTHIRTDWSAIPQDIVDYTIRRHSEYLRDKRIKYKDVSDRPNSPIFYLIEWSSNRHMDIKCLACGGTMSYNGEYYECSGCGYTRCGKDRGIACDEFSPVKEKELHPLAKAALIMSYFVKNFDDNDSKFENAKRYAIFAVNEILNVLQGLHGVSHLDVQDYWKEVKQELERI